MKILSILLSYLLLLSGPAVVAQEQSNSRANVIGPARCHDYGAVLDVIAQNTPPDKLMIVIARLGKGETRADLNRRRLHNVRTYWTEYRSDKRKPETIILAEGERLKDYGQLEVYIEGKLAGVLKVRRNADLMVGTCYPDPLEKDPCILKSDKNFYPCRDRNLPRRKGGD